MMNREQGTGNGEWAGQSAQMDANAPSWCQHQQPDGREMGEHRPSVRLSQVSGSSGISARQNDRQSSSLLQGQSPWPVGHWQVGFGDNPAVSQDPMAAAC